MVTINTLPNELILMITNYLDPVFSTCLGLTYKRLFAIHIEKHGRLSLLIESKNPNPNIDSPTFMEKSFFLHDLLRTWAGPRMVFCHLDSGKFMMPNRRWQRMDEFIMNDVPEKWREVWRDLYWKHKRLERYETQVPPDKVDVALRVWSAGESLSRSLSLCGSRIT